tara:strand:+ start:6261 stop:8189 length:1929 start_codon:yes stop_codon:yes gene_type:complete
MNYSIKLFIGFFWVLNISFTQNIQDIQRLETEYKKALERQSLQKPDGISDAEKAVKSTVIPEKLVYSRKDVESLLVNTDNLLKKLKFFNDSVNVMPFIGYDFFVDRDSIPFWQNLPIPKNYILGPGDEIIIALWGESNSLVTEKINRDGQIFIENIGIINLSGKTIADAKKHILSRYSKVYSTLLGDFPKSFIDLTIGELKSLNVHFVGFVKIPGVHMVHPFSNVISGLIQAGGIDIKGSLRNIEVIRNNKLIATTDLYSYIFEGGSINDVRLMDQDIINVTSRESTIPITGSILRPGYYELLEGENLSDLINFSGGKKRRSSKFIFLFKESFSDNSGYLVNKAEISNFILSNGDSVHVPEKPQYDNYVNIQGQIKNPGKYPFNENLKINELINATMSSYDKDFYETMDLSEINIFRKNPSSSNPLLIKLDSKSNFSLKNGDHITIPKKDILNPIESVVITGEINTPGVYAVNNITNLSDILDISGGYTDYALEDGIEIFRDSLVIGWEKTSFLLKDGDSVNVLKKTGLISIKGEVNSPGYFSFRKNYSWKRYVDLAGGFTAYADKKNVYIKYPNGTSASLTSWLKPKVSEGSTIYVNEKGLISEKELTGWEVFATFSGQASSIATTLISLSILMNQNSSGN